MRLLIWQWGRRGGGPLYAAELFAGLSDVDGVRPLLSLAAAAELLAMPGAPPVALPVATYAGVAGLAWRLLRLPRDVPALAARLRDLAPDAALCALPGPLDLLMAGALRRIGVPYAVVVHDADTHPGDGFPGQMLLQRRVMARADALVVLSAHVADRLRAQSAVGARRLIVSAHPPRSFGPVATPLAHGGRLRLLSFGRLLPYKGLDLLADALALVGTRPDVEIRIVGRGPDSAALSRLRALPGVTVENRWVPEGELADLIGWADALVLCHTEASQSGGAGIAVGTGRLVVATRVGAMAEQLDVYPRALLCEPNAPALAATLRRLFDSPPLAPVPDPAVAWRRTMRTLAADLAGALS